VSALRLTACVIALCVIVCLGAAAAAPDEAALEDMTAEELLSLRGMIDRRLRTLGEYPFERLSSGDKGDEVLALQARLAELGYYDRETDGEFQRATAAAYRAFEKQAGLKQNGVATVEEQKLLFSAEAPTAAPRPTPTPTRTPRPTKTPKPTRTPRPTKTPRPTSTPVRLTDYRDFEYVEYSQMQGKYFESHFTVRGTVLDIQDGGSSLLIMLDDSSGGLVMVCSVSEGASQPGDRVALRCMYTGMTAYESVSGTVRLPLLEFERFI